MEKQKLKNMLKTKRKKQSDVSMMGGRVMERIHHEGIAPTPPSIFLLRNTLVALAISMSALLGIFFTSLCFFRISNIHFFGLRFVSHHFPWFSGGLAFSCLLLTFALLEHYKVFYKTSLVRLFLVVCLVFLALGFLFNKTSLHNRIAHSRFGGMYSVEEPMLQVYAGRVIETRTEKNFVLETLRGDKVRVYIPAGSRLPEQGIKEGESLFIAGYTKAGQFVLSGVLLL